MRTTSISMFIVPLFCLFCASSLPAGEKAGGKAGNNKHAFSCRTCHSTHFPKGRFLWATTPKKKTARGTLLLSTEALCYTCHSEKGKGARFFEPGMSHPVNVVPSDRVKVPPELGTVFVKGVGNVITCTSCHDPHGRRDKFLKLPLEKDELCRACHTGLGK